MNFLEKFLNRFLPYILIIGIIVGFLYSIHCKNEEEREYDIYNKKIQILEDSLRNTIIQQDGVIYKLYNRIDSLENLQKNINNVYEKSETDFIDCGIISDDSIILYISKKIHN